MMDVLTTMNVEFRLKTVSAGRIIEIIAPATSAEHGASPIVLIQPYSVSNENDKHYNMPILTAPESFEGGSTRVGVPPEVCVRLTATKLRAEA